MPKKLMQIKFIPECRRTLVNFLLKIAPKNKIDDFLFKKDFFCVCRSTFKRIFKDLLNWPKWKRRSKEWNPISLHKIYINAIQWILYMFLIYFNLHFYVLIRINDLSSAFHCCIWSRVKKFKSMWWFYCVI